MYELISIIIPCRNEKDDIAKTLDACLALDYEYKEIIVVDDSTDDTPQIVDSYADKGVRLIHRNSNLNGCCGARNLGMQMSNGQIIILLNADDRPRNDFIKQILVHYDNGADFVIVRSAVMNPEVIWGEYTYSQELLLYSKGKFIPWCEGFSCRKTAAQTVGYIPGDFPVPFCRDWMIGAALDKAGYKKVTDLSIKMEHLWPSTIKTYFKNQVHRGGHTSPSLYYFRGMSVKFLLFRETLKASRTVIKYLLLIPAVWNSIMLSHYSPRKWRSIPALFWVGLVNDTAMIYGDLLGWLKLVKEEGFT